MRRPKILPALSVAVLLFASACGLVSGEKVCTANYVAPLVISINDSVTGASLIQGTIVTIKAGDQVVQRDTVPVGAYDLAVPGTYDVFVDRGGYRTWSALGVHTKRDNSGCHAEQVHLFVRLQPNF
ncbi:MAG: hypothetical protein JWO05_1026 [Gemmatimonadetes bacterium]|nr:hypothetical protein [Gemmatimonadota bacterium]